MELPNYLDYGKMYDMNPMAFMNAMEQRDLAQQFKQQKYAQEQEVLKQKQLANLFDEQNNPIRLQQGQADLVGKQQTNRKTTVEADLAEGTKQFKLDEAQRQAVLGAKEHELKAMEAEGWLMMQNPATRAQGQKIIDMSKEFVKMRQEAKDRTDLEAQRHKNALSLEDRRAANALARQQAIAKGKLDAKAGTEKMTTDQLRAHYISKAQAARAAGDMELASELYNEAQYITSLRATDRPDPLAGKPALDQMGVPVTPQRPSAVPPTGRQTSGQVQNQPSTLVDVQKMYPGVPADKLREAYKRKFGVDLK